MSSSGFLVGGKGVVGAADSVCVKTLWVRAASASERVLGVRPEGVLGTSSADVVRFMMGTGTSLSVLKGPIRIVLSTMGLKSEVVEK